MVNGPQARPGGLLEYQYPNHLCLANLNTFEKAMLGMGSMPLDGHEDDDGLVDVDNGAAVEAEAERMRGPYQGRL
ncbi:hypothetical protein HDU97_008657 [Phlyctochytrium planicorne]|nr:hypothetical protein HDU97_008657 [Phlyctochytrium planicorne]